MLWRKSNVSFLEWGSEGKEKRAQEFQVYRSYNVFKLQCFEKSLVLIIDFFNIFIMWFVVLKISIQEAQILFY